MTHGEGQKYAKKMLRIIYMAPKTYLFEVALGIIMIFNHQF
jgi:hypothetical protein